MNFINCGNIWAKDCNNNGINNYLLISLFKICFSAHLNESVRKILFDCTCCLGFSLVAWLMTILLIMSQ